ncbi:hypothetical protein [Streptomyces sp. NPDC054834]
MAEHQLERAYRDRFTRVVAVDTTEFFTDITLSKSAWWQMRVWALKGHAKLWVQDDLPSLQPSPPASPAISTPSSPD